MAVFYTVYAAPQRYVKTRTDTDVFLLTYDYVRKRLRWISVIKESSAGRTVSE